MTSRAPTADDRTPPTPGETSRPPRRRLHRPPTPFRWALLAGAVLAAAACDGDGPDAYGNFEATEVAVSPERSGPLVRFDVAEGQRLEAGAVVGRLDTVPLALQRRELEAQLEAARLRTVEARAQVSVVEAQLATAREDGERIERLYEAEAATAQQRVQARGAVRVLEEQRLASTARVRSATQEIAAVRTRLAQVADQTERSRIINPLSGTVLASFAEAGEFVQVGRPLYTVAALDTLTLRAWVSGAQLASLRLGQEVEVQVDGGPDRLRALPGRITWIASEAEFTPTPIQTREERVDQVYALKVRVPNPDGTLKVGMPGELLLGGEGGAHGPDGGAAAGTAPGSGGTSGGSSP